MKLFLFLILLIVCATTSCDLFNTQPSKSETIADSLSLEWDIQTSIWFSPKVYPKVVNDTLLFYSGSDTVRAINLNSRSVELYSKIPTTNGMWSKYFYFDNQNNSLLIPHFHGSTQLQEYELFNIKLDSRIVDYTFKNVPVWPGSQIKFYNEKYYAVMDLGDLVVFDRFGAFDTLNYDFVTFGIELKNETIFLSQSLTLNGAETLGRILAIDANTLVTKWQYDTDQGGFMLVHPQVENGVLYCGTYLGGPSYFFAIDASSGELIWQSEDDQTSRFFILEDDGIYTNGSNHLYKLEKTTGKTIWKIPFEGTGHGNIVYKNGVVYHHRDRELLAINATTGEVIHRVHPPDLTYFWHVAESEEYIFAQSSDHMYAYKPVELE